MGGEKASTRALSSATVGSPPRRRGKAEEPREPGTFDRITPAWAGKSGSLCFANLLTQDHPRAGGEKITDETIGTVIQGSPPHGRGKTRHLSHGLLPCG